MPSKTFDCAVSRMDQDAEDIDICDALGMDFDAIAQEEDAELGWCAGTNAEQGESDSESSAASSAREHGAFQEQTSAPEHRSSKEIPQAQTQVESIAMHESAGDVKVDTVPVTVPDSGAIAHLPDDEQVLLFDAATTTYVCILDRSSWNAREYYRVAYEEPWARVLRTDRTAALQHEEAGVPRSIPWSGPTIVVYTNGKKEARKESGQNPRKYYQWCKECCSAGCDNRSNGCSKTKCWIAPRKWRTHAESQNHINSLGINCRLARQSMAISMHLAGHELAPAFRSYASMLNNSARISFVGGNVGGHLGGSVGGHLAPGAGGLRVASSTLGLQVPRDGGGNGFQSGESGSEYTASWRREHGEGGGLDDSIKRAQDENLCLKAVVDNLQTAILGHMQHEGQSEPSQIEGIHGASRGGPPLISCESAPHGRVPVTAPRTGARAAPTRAGEVLIILEGGSSSSDGLVHGKKIASRQKATLCSLTRLLLTRHQNVGHANALRILLLDSPQRAFSSQSSGRILVMLSIALDPEVENRLRSEIGEVCAFISALSLSDPDIQFVKLEALEELGEGEGTFVGDGPLRDDPRARVVVMAFNRRGVAAYIGDDALAEICESENGPVSWSLCGELVSVSWVRQDQGAENAESSTSADGLVMVYNESKSSAVGIYYPKEFANFFAEQSLLCAFKPDNFLGRKLSPEVGRLYFMELKQE